jgi:cytochrome c-type biogenesis protein CcmH/NrfG
MACEKERERERERERKKEREREKEGETVGRGVVTEKLLLLLNTTITKCYMSGNFSMLAGKY